MQLYSLSDRKFAKTLAGELINAHLFKTEKDNREDSQASRCSLCVGGGREEKMVTSGKDVITWVSSDSATGTRLWSFLVFMTLLLPLLPDLQPF